MDSGQRYYLVSGACFEHVAHIGRSVERMNDFTATWLQVLGTHCCDVAAWIVLPNHYHALVACGDVFALLKGLGQLHGRTSFHWNGEENTRGRQVWCNAAETLIKSSDHYYATVNYVHHNAVKHSYVTKWTEWAWCSALDYLEAVGRNEAERLWLRYPVEGYGKEWDAPEI
jgi:putative transposase